MFDGMMLKGLRTGLVGVAIAVAPVWPALADDPVARGGAPALATPVSGAQLSEVRGGLEEDQPPGTAQVKTGGAGFGNTISGGDTLPGNVVLSYPKVGSGIASAFAHLEQRLTDVSMIAR